MRHAFTLVELAIVLVVIGLLVGGVLVGESLIHVAELRAQVREFESINGAHYAFRNKYNCVPGDCAEIDQFFTAVTPGNGNSRVDCWPSSGPNECGTYFVSLQRAGMLEDRTSNEYRPSKTGNGYTYVHFQDRYLSGGYTPVTLFGQGVAWIHLVSPNSPWANGPVFKPEDAWNADIKADDGRPQTGKFLAANGAISSGSYLTTCNTGNAYTIPTPDPACRVLYKVE